MIVLDTNVISELVKPTFSQVVFDWVDAQPRSELATTTIVEAEILSGHAFMPEGERKRRLEKAIANVLAQIEYILPFTRETALHYSQIAAVRRAEGRPLAGFDGLIAATARANGAAIATRNVRDFEGCGVDLIDPWTA